MSHNTSHDAEPRDVAAGVTLRSFTARSNERVRALAAGRVRPWRLALWLALLAGWFVGAHAWRPWWALATPPAAVLLVLWRHERRIEKRLRRLHRWCSRLGISTPEPLDYRETELGEWWELRVTGRDDEGKLMTTARFVSLAGAFRDVIGDECRHVKIDPVREHGGRVTFSVQWRDPTAGTAEAFNVGPGEWRIAHTDAEAEEYAELAAAYRAHLDAEHKAHEAERRRLWAEADEWERLERERRLREWEAAAGALDDLVELDDDEADLDLEADDGSEGDDVACAPAPAPACATEPTSRDLAIRGGRPEPGERGEAEHVPPPAPSAPWGPPAPGTGIEAPLEAALEAAELELVEALVRPPDAGEGTRTGTLWELLAIGDEHSAAWLAGRVNMAPKSVGNALRRWEALGLIGRRPGPRGDTWYAVSATLPMHGDEETRTGSDS